MLGGGVFLEGRKRGAEQQLPTASGHPPGGLWVGGVASAAPTTQITDELIVT